MGDFVRVKDDKGHFMMQPTPEPSDIKPVQLGQPSATVPGKPKRYQCTACTPPKKFAGIGVMSMHFNRQHKDLVQDADTWRQYMETVDVTGGA